MSTPTSAGDQSTSFKTNVNRAKTKRWVEAKSYSYDGDDWGEYDDYDEYSGYDEPPPPSKPTGFRQRGQSATKPQEEGIGHNYNEAPIDKDKPLAGNSGAFQPQQHRDRSSPIHSATQQQPNLRRSSSFEPDDERRLFPINTGSQDTHGTLAQTYPSANYFQNVQMQDYYPGHTEPTESRRHYSGQTNPPGESPNRDDIERQSRHGSQATPGIADPHGHWSADQTRSTGIGSRTQSMTSDSFSADLYDRRDFSPSAVPLPLNTRNSPSPHSDARNRPPRNSSLSQHNQPSLPFNPQIPPSISHETHAEHPTKERTSSSSSSKALHFVRPADIYRRMEEEKEKEKERQSQESSRPSVDALFGRPSEPQSVDKRHESDTARRPKVKLNPVSERKSDYGFEGVGIPDPSKGDSPSVNIEKPRTTSKTFEIKSLSRPSGPQASNNSLGMILPDPTRMSGFGEGFGDSFLGSEERLAHSPHERFSSTENDDPSSSLSKEGDVRENRDLQHQPSKGFTSAVHQAFDTAQDQTPPTPSSTANSSVGRSASGGTSTVSPIMSRGPSAVDRGRGSELPSIDDVTTPTQDEEDKGSKLKHRSADSFGTLTKASLVEGAQNEPIEPPPPGFKMGHRRDSSTPSPDNSPAKIPALTSMSHLRHPQEADFAEVTPTPTDSTPSTSSSLRASKTSSANNYSQSASISDSNVNQSASSLPQNIQSSSSPTQPSFNHRTNSNESGHVKNLADKFESHSRPESTHSNTTPRASMLSLNSSGSKDLAPSRPINERSESFRPHLPGGWESSASIAPASLASPQTALGGSDMSQGNVLKISLPGQDSQHQKNEPLYPEGIKDTSVSAFSAAAEAGTPLVGAFVAAVGLDTTPDAGHSTQRPSKMNNTYSATNTDVHLEAARPEMPDLSNDDSKVSTPLSKDTSRHLKDDQANVDYVSPSTQNGTMNSVPKEPLPSKPQVSLPHLSTDVRSSKYESDRLRREIVKELSPGLPSEPTTAESETPDQAPIRYSTQETISSKDRESGGLPSEYDSYWNDESDDVSSTHERDQGQAMDANVNTAQHSTFTGDASLSSSQAQPRPSAEASAVIQSAPDKSRVLTHRFSWEQPLADFSSPTESRPPELSSSQTVQIAPDSTFLESHVYPENRPGESQTALSGPSKSPPNIAPPEAAESAFRAPPVSESISPAKTSLQTVEGDREGNENHPKSFGGLEVSPSLTEKHSLRSSEETDGKISHSPQERSQPVQPSLQHSSTVQEAHQVWQSNQTLSLPPPLPPANAQPNYLAFREIKALPTAAERIKGFNDTRQQVANANTGLAHWLAITTSNLPEHSDLLRNGGRTGLQGPGHRPSPSRAKLAALIPGSQHGSSYHQQIFDANPQVSSPSGITEGAVNSSSGGSGGRSSSQQVQAKSKEFLHSAGVFGGRANTAAKGFFSKGKSKLRDASGSKKASPLTTPPATPGFSSQGMQPQQGAPQIPTNKRQTEPNANCNSPTSQFSPQYNQPSVHNYTLKSERDAQSIQSLTQSQLADDERSEDSVAEKADRLPRSSKIYCKRDSLGGGKSQPDEVSASDAGTGHNPPQEPYAAGSLAERPKQERSPQPTESNNKTPTQAYFDRTKTQDLPLKITPANMPPDSQQDKDCSEESHIKHGIELSGERGADHATTVTRLGLDKALNGHSPQSQFSEAVQRTSIGSRHQSDAEVAGNGNQYGQSRDNLSAHPGLSRSSLFRAQSLQQPAQRSPLPTRDSKNTLPVHSQPETADQSMLRLPSQDFSVGRPSLESIPSRIDPDRPPSPISPHSPTQSTQDLEDRSVLSIQHGADHDLAKESDSQQVHQKSSSFIRPFQESEARQQSHSTNLHKHPAYREGTPLVEDLAVLGGSSSESKPREVPEDTLDSISPHDLPLTESRSRSQRGSKGSAFFKSFAKSFADSDSQPMPESSVDRLNDSPKKPSINADRKDKRSSVLYYPNSQTNFSNGDIKSNENVTPTSAPKLRSSKNVQLPTSPAPPKPLPWADDDEFPMRPKQRSSTGLSKKLQRASTAVAKGEDGGKKKNRFSSIGTLFGRSGHKARSSATNISRPSVGQSQQVSQSILPTTPGSSGPYRVATAPGPHPSPATSVSSPREGYYAPKRGSSPQRSDAAFSRDQQSAVVAYSTHRSDAPAYFQDASFRQPGSKLTTPNQTKSRRTSVEFFGKTSPPNVSQHPAALPSQNSMDRVSPWTRYSTSSRSKGYKPQNESATLQYNNSTSSAAAFVPQAQQQTSSRSDSPPPPPPPPKDEWHSVRPRQSSLRAPSHLSSPDPPSHVGFSASASQQQRQSLPQLQTNVPSPHLGPLRSGISSGTNPRSSMTPEEKRRSRQLEIEIGHMSTGKIQSPDGKMSAGGLGGVKEEGGIGEDDERIEMSATSFPGQEWHPPYDYSWGD